MPSNAQNSKSVVQPVLHQRHGSEEEKVFADTLSDFGIMLDSGRKKFPTKSFTVESGTGSPQTVLIDNTNLIYVEIKLPCGIMTRCSPEVLWDRHRPINQ